MKKILMICLICFVSIGYGNAQDLAQSQIKVNGFAKKEVTPDKMTWNLFIKNKNLTLQKAAKDHAKIVESVIAFLKETKISKEDIQTSRSKLAENIVYRNNNRVKEGYFATTAITFMLTDFKKYNPLWFGLSKIEQVSVQGISYDYSKREEVQNLLLEQALRNAKTKAKTLANAVGSEIGEPLLIEDSSTMPRYNSRKNMELAMASDSQRSGGSFSLGKIIIQANIRAVFRLISIEH